MPPHGLGRELDDDELFAAPPPSPPRAHGQGRELDDDELFAPSAPMSPAVAPRARRASLARPPSRSRLSPFCNPRGISIRPSQASHISRPRRHISSTHAAILAHTTPLRPRSSTTTIPLRPSGSTRPATSGARAPMPDARSLVMTVPPHSSGKAAATQWRMRSRASDLSVPPPAERALARSLTRDVSTAPRRPLLRASVRSDEKSIKKTSVSRRRVIKTSKDIDDASTITREEKNEDLTRIILPRKRAGDMDEVQHTHKRARVNAWEQRRKSLPESLRPARTVAAVVASFADAAEPDGVAGEAVHPCGARRMSRLCLPAARAATLRGSVDLSILADAHLFRLVGHRDTSAEALARLEERYAHRADVFDAAWAVVTKEVFKTECLPDGMVWWREFFEQQRNAEKDRLEDTSAKLQQYYREVGKADRKTRKMETRQVLPLMRNDRRRRGFAVGSGSVSNMERIRMQTARDRRRP